ncbi:MAG: FAD-dependent monooxygenase [Acidobacteria bacterium]|nr:FAD-dependent monooxygenase [Acidobacteriota bacterium]
MRVLICGAGIAGLTVAWCLERRGHDSVVVERAAHLRDDGYMIDFFGSGFGAAERLGLLPDLESIHYPVNRLVFVNQRGQERFSVPYAALWKRLFANRHFNFMRGELERVLYERFTGRAAIRFNTTVAAFAKTDWGVNVTLTDGATESVHLLVGADGMHSSVRQLAFGTAAPLTRQLGYHMAAFILDNPPRQFHARGAFVTLTCPNRQVTVYPIRGGRLATFFLHKASAPLQETVKEAACDELHLIYGDLGWVVPDLLAQCRTAQSIYFDAVEQVQMPTWSTGRVVLVGDACQCVSPLAGQGASMALTAGYVLVEELDAHGDVSRALTRYEERLKPTIERQQQAGRRMAKWFVPEDEPHRIVRDLVTRMSTWPGVAELLRRRMAAESMLGRV